MEREVIHRADDEVEPFVRLLNMFRGSGMDGPLEADELVGPFVAINGALENVEKYVEWQITVIIREILEGKCTESPDVVFGLFTGHILGPYAESGFGHRAATFARECLIPSVLNLEVEKNARIHKGALFYDTALAHLIIGDHARFEYFLAMADEENHQTTIRAGKASVRGELCLKAGELSSQTIAPSISFGVSLLNGGRSKFKANYRFMFGTALTSDRFDVWRRRLDAHHQAELFRALHEAEIFLGGGMPGYDLVHDHPHVMLRLVKSLTHLSQWVESWLTQMQKPLLAGKKLTTFRNKLTGDPKMTAHRIVGNFPGPPILDPAALDTKLKDLLSKCETEVDAVQRERILLQILYLIRNATAHQIDESLAVYSDRNLLTQLIQAVCLSAFVIENAYAGAAP